MPQIPQAIVAMLASCRLGAIHSLVFGGFGSKISKLIICLLKSQYQQKPHDLKSEGQKIVSRPFFRIPRAKVEYEPQF